jgi:hypothetical protein
MIELTPTDRDDPAFLTLTQWIINGAVAAHEVREVFLVHIDTWFDHKWLGWWSRKAGELRVPPFTPRRVLSEKRFVRSGDPPMWTSAGLEKPLHIRQLGRALLGRPLDRYSKDAAFVWYSGSTATNTLGCLMFYRSCAERYSWYASTARGMDWAVSETFRVSPGELRWFEERGRQLQAVQA